jgi:hypothetical protein
MKIDVEVYDREEDGAPGAIFLEADDGNVLLHVRTNEADAPVTAVLTRFDIGVLVGALTWIEQGVDVPA